MVKGAASRKSLSSKKKNSRKNDKPKLTPKNTKKEEIDDILCCCGINKLDTAVECTLSSAGILDHCTMWFRQYNHDTGFVPNTTGFSPGFLACYLTDAIAHYLYLHGAFGDTAPYDMGAYPLPFTLACLVKETFAKKKLDGAIFVPRPTGFNNTTINAATYLPGGSFNSLCIDESIPLVSGEPVFGPGVALSVAAVRAKYPDFAARIVSYGGVQISEIPEYSKGFDFFFNRTTMVENLPLTRYLSIAEPTADEFGMAGVLQATVSLHPNPGQCSHGAYYWIMSHFRDVKMTYRKALSALGYDPLSASVHAEPINLSKLRGLITTFAQFRGVHSWGSNEQDEFVTALVAYVSQIYCRTPQHLCSNGSNVPGWATLVWRDMPTFACLGEVGTLPRRVDNTLWFPYFAINSVTYPNGCSLMALIQPAIPITASYNEDFDEFPFNFTFSAPLLVCEQTLPTPTDKINFVPLYVYSEAQRALAGYSQELLVPMPKMKPITPAIIAFVKSKNTTLLGTMSLVLPGPSEYSCFAVCTRKECSILPGLGLFTRRSIGKYAGYSSDISGEYWIRLIRASAIVTANVVSAGQGGNAPQSTISRMFYNQLLGDIQGRPGYMPSRNLLRAADLWRSEGNTVQSISESSLLDILSSPTWANTVVAAVAGAMYTFNGVRGLINRRPGYDLLF